MKAGDQLLIAALAQAKGQMEVHKANIQVYQSMPAGIGEHPDVVAECSKLVKEISDARELRDTVKSLIETNQEK